MLVYKIGERSIVSSRKFLKIRLQGGLLLAKQALS